MVTTSTYVLKHISDILRTNASFCCLHHHQHRFTIFLYPETFAFSNVKRTHTYSGVIFKTYVKILPISMISCHSMMHLCVSILLAHWFFFKMQNHSYKGFLNRNNILISILPIHKFIYYYLYSLFSPINYNFTSLVVLF